MSDKNIEVAYRIRGGEQSLDERASAVDGEVWAQPVDTDIDAQIIKAHLRGSVSSSTPVNDEIQLGVTRMEQTHEFRRLEVLHLVQIEHGGGDVEHA
jgi:hypothetical protein